LADVCTPALAYADIALLVITASKYTVRLNNIKPKKSILGRNPPGTRCNHLNCKPQNDSHDMRDVQPETLQSLGDLLSPKRWVLFRIKKLTP